MEISWSIVMLLRMLQHATFYEMLVFQDILCAAKYWKALKHEMIVWNFGLRKKPFSYHLQTNFFRDNQRRVSTVKYLGEMYNYQLVDSDVIFMSLYMLITFGSALESKNVNFIRLYKNLLNFNITQSLSLFQS